MTKPKPITVLTAMLIGGAVVIASMILFVGPLFESKKTSAECSHTNASHTAVIQNGKITPEHTDAKKCDTLTIINQDKVIRLMAFGQHEKHIVYDGNSENRLSPGQSFTVTLNQTGTYLIHDHLDENVSTDFSVTE